MEGNQDWVSYKSFTCTNRRSLTYWKPRTKTLVSNDWWKWLKTYEVGQRLKGLVGVSHIRIELNQHSYVYTLSRLLTSIYIRKNALCYRSIRSQLRLKTSPSVNAQSQSTKSARRSTMTYLKKVLYNDADTSRWDNNIHTILRSSSLCPWSRTLPSPASAVICGVDTSGSVYSFCL